MTRLLIISNRLPFTIDKSGDDIIVRQSSGGLVSAIKSYFEQSSNEGRFSEKIWIGNMDAEAEDWQMAKDMNALELDFTVEPLFPDKKLYDSFYNGFSNSTLWPLFHYFPSLIEVKEDFYESYKKINQQFANRIIELYQPGDVIWVHDYQLMLLPQMLRQRLPQATIGFFLHIPFPSYEIYRLMPTAWKKQILEGMLGADLVGFHTHEYVQHFIQSCKMILQVENQFSDVQFGDRSIRVDLFPIGIDYNRFRSACFDEGVVAIANGLEDRFEGMKVIFSVDRLDYTKGLNYRLDGYECFLQSHPEWVEKVIFILNVVPSRDNIPAYNDRKGKIEEKVSMINGKFSTLHWQPLLYRYNHLGFDELCALYQTADVALITPLRDGMNLVAKEYVASCIDKGVLILSELTGAANELSEAILVNPTDNLEVADALDTALRMPLVEQRSRLLNMQRRIASYDVQKWINEFIGSLTSTKKEQEAMKVNVLKEDITSDIVQRFHEANKRAILLDYDGTLAPYQKLPSLAMPTQDLLQLLLDLTQEPENEVVIISGRDAPTLDRWLGHLPLTLVAEHGAAIKYKNEDWKEVVSINAEWKDQIRPMMQLFVDRCAGSFVEEKKSTLAWHYRNTHPELGFTRSRELRNSLLQMTTNTPLQVIDGNKVLEVRMSGVDKGVTSRTVLDQLHSDFVICLGDDATDEDMFRALADRAVTIKIGSGNTAAQYTILTQQGVFPFLRHFLKPIGKQHEQSQI